MLGVIGIAGGVIGQITVGAAALSLGGGFDQASEAVQQIRTEVYGAVFQVGDFGLTRVLYVSLIGVWQLGIGRYLRAHRPALGTSTMAIGAVGLLISLAEAFRLEAADDVVFIWIILEMLWSVWVGIALLRSKASTSPS